jgi:hypothetical protein
MQLEFTAATDTNVPTTAIENANEDEAEANNRERERSPILPLLLHLKNTALFLTISSE